MAFGYKHVFPVYVDVVVECIRGPGDKVCTFHPLGWALHRAPALYLTEVLEATVYFEVKMTIENK